MERNKDIHVGCAHKRIGPLLDLALPYKRRTKGQKVVDGFGSNLGESN